MWFVVARCCFVNLLNSVTGAPQCETFSDKSDHPAGAPRLTTLETSISSLVNSSCPASKVVARARALDNRPASRGRGSGCRRSTGVTCAAVTAPSRETSSFAVRCATTSTTSGALGRPRGQRTCASGSAQTATAGSTAPQTSRSACMQFASSTKRSTHVHRASTTSDASNSPHSYHRMHWRSWWPVAPPLPPRARRSSLARTNPTSTQRYALTRCSFSFPPPISPSLLSPPPYSPAGCGCQLDPPPVLTRCGRHTWR